MEMRFETRDSDLFFEGRGKELILCPVPFNMTEADAHKHLPACWGNPLVVSGLAWNVRMGFKGDREEYRVLGISPTCAGLFFGTGWHHAVRAEHLRDGLGLALMYAYGKSFDQLYILPGNLPMSLDVATAVGGAVRKAMNQFKGGMHPYCQVTTLIGLGRHTARMVEDAERAMRDAYSSG